MQNFNKGHVDVTPLAEMAKAGHLQLEIEGLTMSVNSFQVTSVHGGTFQLCVS